MFARKRPRWTPALIPFLLLIPTATVVQGRGDAAAAPTVKIATTRMLVTPAGMTLYQFAGDKQNQSTCSGGCAKAWPPFLAHGAIPSTLPHGAGAFGTAARGGGLKQVTFKGAPLYTFAGDKKPGEANGQGTIQQWWVVPAPAISRAAGTAFVATAPLRTLVTARGMSIYMLSTDKPGHAGCTGACAKFWPPVLVSAPSRVPAAQPVITGTFGVTPGPASARQLTFNGAPLYTFVKDRKPGDMNGEGVAHVWWVVVVLPRASAGAPAPTASPTATPQATATTASSSAGAPTAVASPTSTTQAAATATATDTATALATATQYVYKHY